MDYNEEEISNEIIEWINYFMLFDVDSINNKIVNKPANNMLNKDKESILIIKDKLFNQTYQLNNPLLNKEFDQNKNKCVNNLLNDYNVEGNQNKNIILNEKNIEININEKQFLIEIKNKETLNFNNNDTKKNNITNTEKKKEFKNMKLQKFYNLSTDFNNETDNDIYPKNNKYNYIKSIEKIPLTNPNKIKFTNKSSSLISNNENKNNEINKIYKNFLNIKSNQNIKNPTNENILLQSRNKSQGINSQKNVSNNLRINTFENNKEMNKTQKIKKENNKEMIHNKINSNPNLKTINSKNNIFVEMTLLKDVSYTSLYQWKVLYKKRDPNEYNYENKNDNYKSEFFSFNNEPIDIQKPYRVTKNFKGLAKVKYLDENNILKQFNQEDIDDDKEKIIKKDNSNVYFMRKNKRNKNKNEKISNNKKYNIHKDFINRVENFQSIN